MSDWLPKIREHLARSLRRRLSFDAAWRNALAAHPAPLEWVPVREFARQAFRRAYMGEVTNRGLIEPEPEGERRERKPVASGADGRCRSGDRCPRVRASGSLFCEHHRDELAAIRAQIEQPRFNAKKAA